MSGLADLQAGIRTAVVEGDMSAVAPLLRGGSDPRKRLAIHHRHYTSSLVTALVDRFPATVWLVGSPLVTDAARAFVQTHPPTHAVHRRVRGSTFRSFLRCDPALRRCPISVNSRSSNGTWAGSPSQSKDRR